MTIKLFVDSSNSVDLDPEWDFADQSKKVENVHRTRAGNRFTYKWGSYTSLKFSTNFVSSSTAAIINSWWSTNTKLLFQAQSSTAVTSVQLTNGTIPLGKFNKPSELFFSGSIQLETY